MPALASHGRVRTASRRAPAQLKATDVKRGTRGEEVGMKFLVVWKMEISRLSAEMMKTVLRMPDYAKPLYAGQLRRERDPDCGLS